MSKTKPIHLFDEERVAPLVLEWQQSRDNALFERILSQCQRLLHCLVMMHYPPDILATSDDEIFQGCAIKLMHIIGHYNPSKGRLFSLISISIQRFFICRDFKRTQYRDRHEFISDEEGFDGLAPVLPPPEAERSFKEFAGIYLGSTRFRRPVELELQTHCLQRIYETGKVPSESSLEPLFRLPRKHVHLLRDYLLVRLRTLFYQEKGIGVRKHPPVPRSGVRASLLPHWCEVRAIIGEEVFCRLCTVFGGMRITFPDSQWLTAFRTRSAELQLSILRADETRSEKAAAAGWVRRTK